MGPSLSGGAAAVATVRGSFEEERPRQSIVNMLIKREPGIGHGVGQF